MSLTDKQNKQSQNLLNLEILCCTEDPWIYLLITTLGMCVVDMHRWYRNKIYFEQIPQEASGQSIVGNEFLDIQKFSDQLYVNLERKQMIRRASAVSIWHMVTRRGEKEQEALERIARYGSVTQDKTERQMNTEHWSVG
jgi:hypothetical protein